MELVKHIKEWYAQVPQECKGYITQQMTWRYPGIPASFRELSADGLSLIIQKMELDEQNLNVGDVAAFMGCMDYVLYKYDDINQFLDQIEFDKEVEAEMIFRESFDGAADMRKRIDNAPAELAARQITATSWEALKAGYLNYDYLREYSMYLLRENTKRMAKNLWNDIFKKGG